MNSYYFFVSTGIIIILLSLARIPQGFKDIVFTCIGLLIVFVAQKFIKKDVLSITTTETIPANKAETDSNTPIS